MKLLCMLANPNMLPSNDYMEVDNLELLLGQICMNRIAGIAYINFNKCNNFFVPKEFRNTLRDLWSSNKQRNLTYIEDLMYIGDILKSFNKKYAFLKGVFLITQIYDIGCRTSNDFDILIQEKDLNEFEKLLSDNGFVQGRAKDEGGVIPASRKEILLSRMNYGETVPFIKYFKGHNIVVDLNISVDFKPEKERSIVEVLLENCTTIDVNGCSVNTLKLEFFLIHLCCHLYKEATTIYWVKNHRDLQLYKFCDIYILLEKYLNNSFARNLANIIIKYGVDRECYYTIYNTAEIFPQLREIEGYSNLLLEIKPDDMSFMKKIIDPANKKRYSYSMSFIDWFECQNRYEKLIQSKEEKNNDNQN